MSNCVDCKFLHTYGGGIGQPYPEVCCSKEHFDGIGPEDDLYEENNCKDFDKKEPSRWLKNLDIKTEK